MTAYRIPNRTRRRGPQAIRMTCRVDRAEIERIDAYEELWQRITAGLLVASAVVAVLGIGYVNAAFLGVPQ